jgi:hypothetical protein
VAGRSCDWTDLSRSVIDPITGSSLKFGARTDLTAGPTREGGSRFLDTRLLYRGAILLGTPTGLDSGCSPSRLHRCTIFWTVLGDPIMCVPGHLAPPARTSSRHLVSEHLFSCIGGACCTTTPC